MKNIIQFLSIILLSLNSAVAQTNTPSALGWKQHSIVTKNEGTINYYITENKSAKKKPLLLYIDGSGAFPLFQLTDRGTGSTVLLRYKKLSDSFHIVLISKPGVPFIDSVKMDAQQGYPIYKTPDEYRRRLSLHWRVNAADTVLKDVLAHYNVDRKKVAILGISEGFQVAAKLAAINKNVTHSLLMVGNGLTQFYDFIIQNRLDAQSGKISYETAQENIDSLQATFRDIYANSSSTDKEWYGHTYLRWSSFCANQPVNDILKSDIPTYIVAASKDRNTSVLSTDYIALEATRLKRNNITYKVYPYDHSFSEMMTDEKGNPAGRKNHMQEVMDEAISWLKGN